METTSLAEICRLNMGQSPPSSTYNTESRGLPFYQGNADFGVRHPTTRIWCDTPTKIAHEGDILLSVRAPIGALNIAAEDCCIGRGLAALTANPEKIDSLYLYYALQSRTKLLAALGTGSTFTAVSKAVVSELPMPIYPLTEQKRIALVFDTIEKTLDNLRRQLLLFDDLVKSQFVELFGDPVTNPMRWNVKSLGDVCDIRDGTHDSPRYCGHGFPLVTSKNVTSGKIDLSDCNYVSKIDYEKINQRSKVDIGDIIMPMIGTVGCPVIVDFEPNFAIKNVALFKFKNIYKVDKFYVKSLL